MRCFHVWLLVRLPCFPCVCPLFPCLLLFAILAAPSISPFQFVPLLQCVFHAFLVCVLCPVVSVFPVPVPPPFCFLGRTSFFCPMRFVPLTCVPCFPFACSLSRCTRLSYSRAFYSLSFCRTPFLRLRAFRFTCAPSLFFLRVPAVSARPPFLFFPPLSPHRFFLLFLLHFGVFLPLFSALFLSFFFH